MELESVSSYPPHSPMKAHQFPPDVNTGESLFTQHHWYSNIVIPWPVIYGIHLLLAIIFGGLTLAFGLTSGGIISHPAPFWDVFPEFICMAATVVITYFIQFFLLPAFWRIRARQLLNGGFFDSSKLSQHKGGRRLVLEVGCNEGKTSATFARAIIERQRDVGNLTAPHAALPTFVGYDRWRKWSRFPNNPACYLATMMHAGVPRECIVANRMDISSKEAKTHFPYPSESISLIICNLGLSELLVNTGDRGNLFRDLVRILEPGGSMVVVENKPVSKFQWSRIFEGSMKSYQRILVEEMGWPKENAITRNHWSIPYLVAVKPTTGARQTV